MSNPYLQQVPGPVHRPAPKKSDPLALTSVIVGGLSIAATLFTCIPYIGCVGCFIFPVLAIVAIVCGFIAVANNSPQKGMAWAGVICGFVSFLIFGIMIALALILGIGLNLANNPGMGP